MLKIEQKKKGYSTIVGIITMLIILPILLFAVVDLPFYLESNKKVKSIADNVSASASTILIPELLAEGVVEINEEKAETYILEDLAVWFNLEPIIYKTDVANVKAMKLKDGKKSLLNNNPLIIRITPDLPPIVNEDVLKATRIEYFIHTSNGRATYRFTSGQKVNVSSPTVAVNISTKVRGVLFQYPVVLKKIGMTEAVFDAQNK